MPSFQQVSPSPFPQPTVYTLKLVCPTIPVFPPLTPISSYKSLSWDHSYNRFPLIHTTVSCLVQHLARWSCQTIFTCAKWMAVTRLWRCKRVSCYINLIDQYFWFKTRDTTFNRFTHLNSFLSITIADSKHHLKKAYLFLPSNGKRESLQSWCLLQYRSVPFKNKQSILFAPEQVTVYWYANISK